MKALRLGMFFEIRYPYFVLADHADRIINLLEERFTCSQQNKTELYFQPHNATPGGLEIKIEPRSLGFTVNLCPSYKYFTEIVEANLDKVMEVLMSDDLDSLLIRSQHLYPIKSIDHFFELVSLLSEDIPFEFNDSGVRLLLKAEGMKIHMTCRYMARNQVKTYFPSMAEIGLPELNLFVYTEIASNIPRSLSTLRQAVQNLTATSTGILEEKLDQVLNAQ
jgi:hypothetical protein